MNTENQIPKFVKVVVHLFGYLVLLFVSLSIAVDKWMDIADPPTLEIPYSFWLSRWGQFLLFSFAFVAPAFVLIVFSFAARWVWRHFERGSHVVA